MAAATGVAIVAANFLAAGAILSLAARISLTLFQVAALFGFLLRLGLVMGAMVLMVQWGDLDPVALGLAAVLGYLALLSWEAAAVSRRSLDLGGEVA